MKTKVKKVAKAGLTSFSLGLFWSGALLVGGAMVINYSLAKGKPSVPLW